MAIGAIGGYHFSSSQLPRPDRPCPVTCVPSKAGIHLASSSLCASLATRVASSFHRHSWLVVRLSSSASTSAWAAGMAPQ
jgi:hypothetical protein